MSEAAGRPWVAEREVPPALARSLLDQQFPPLRGAPLRPFGAGWDNTAYLVDEAWVFRFPRRRIAVPFMEAELRNLPCLAGRLPVPVPAPQWIGRPSPDFPWPFGGYRLLSGVPVHADLDPATQALARLRGLHSAACCLEYAHDIGDEAMTAYTQRALVHLLE